MKLLEFITEGAGRTQNVSHETIDLVKELFDQGLTYEEISTKTKLTTGAIHGILDRHYSDRAFRKVRPTPEVIDTIKKLYDKRMSYDEIGVRVGMLTTDVGRILQNYYKERARRRREYTPEENLEMGEMFAKGLPLHAIGKKFDLVGLAITKQLETLPNYYRLLKQRNSR